jgi:hypothetical protein
MDTAVILYSESPLHPNWSDSYVVELSFKTDIKSSRSGREQRRATRDEPRKKLEFSVNATRTRFGSFNRLLERWMDRPIILPELPRRVRLEAPLLGGNVVAFLAETAPDWIIDGGQVVLVYKGYYETRTVDAIAGDEVTFVEFTDMDWPIGTTVHPALSGLLSESQSSQRHTNQAATANVEFDVIPGSEPERTIPAAAETFNGRETFMTKFNWATLPSVAVVSERETIDYDVGPIEVFTPIAFRMRTVKAAFLGRTFAEAEAMQNFFERMKGRRGEFYMPTWEPDIQIFGTAASGTNTLMVEGTEFARDFADSTIHKAICVFMQDGTTIYRLVTAIAEVGDDSRITVTGNWSTDLTADNVRMISWFLVCRHATDTLQIEWLTNSVAQYQLSILALEAL